MKCFAMDGGPGTGKTTVCKNIFMKAIKKGYSSAYETFRRNMAQDFIDRLEDVDKVDLSYVSTTHGICYRLISRELGNFEVATKKDWKDFCKKIGIPVNSEELIWDETQDKITHITELESTGAKVYTLYANCVNMLVDFDKWYSLPSSMIPYLPEKVRNEFPTIVDKWVSYLESTEKIDFPMMLYKAYELKLELPTDVYIADEFQDKTKIQFELFKLWSKDKEAVVVAFNKPQTIYRFWGTDPEYCDWVKERSKFKVLSPSWRLSQEVYNKALYLLKISGQEAINIECVGNTIIKEIHLNDFVKVVKNFSDIMILARTNYHLFPIAKILTEHGIPFFGRFGWSDKQYRIYSFVWKYRNLYEPIYKHEFLEYLKSTKAYPKATLEFFKKAIPAKLNIEYVNNYLPSTHKMILKSDKPFSNTDLTDKGVEKLTIAILHNTPPRNDIFLTTIHGSKGLEANTVIVFDGITPKIQDSLMKDKKDWQNEYRVWFVALTRAKEYCFIIRETPAGFSVPFLPGVLNENR